MRNYYFFLIFLFLFLLCLDNSSPPTNSVCFISVTQELSSSVLDTFLRILDERSVEGLSSALREFFSIFSTLLHTSLDLLSAILQSTASPSHLTLSVPDSEATASSVTTSEAPSSVASEVFTMKPCHQISKLSFETVKLPVNSRGSDETVISLQVLCSSSAPLGMVLVFCCVDGSTVVSISPAASSISLPSPTGLSLFYSEWYESTIKWFLLWRH